MVFFALFWTCMVCVFDAFMIWDAMRREQAQSYPSTQGTIIRSHIEINHSTDGTTYGPEVDFSYEVEGKFYTSDTYRYGVWSSSDRSHAESVVDRYSNGKQVEVFYNPTDPSDAVLEHDNQGMDLSLALFMTPFNVVMLGFWAYYASLIKRKIIKSPAGGVPIRQHQGRTHIRLPLTTPIASAGYTAFGISFASIFVVGFGLGFNPSMGAIQIVWACVLIPTIFVYFNKKFAIGSGIKDLVIDDANEAILLPKTFGRKNNVIVSLSAVTDISVKEKVSTSSDGDSIQYSIALVHTKGDKSINSKLIEWYDENRANQFADWLRDRLGLTI